MAPEALPKMLRYQDSLFEIKTFLYRTYCRISRPSYSMAPKDRNKCDFRIDMVGFHPWERRALNYAQYCKVVAGDISLENPRSGETRGSTNLT